MDKKHIEYQKDFDYLLTKYPFLQSQVINPLELENFYSYFSKKYNVSSFKRMIYAPFLPMNVLDIFSENLACFGSSYDTKDIRYLLYFQFDEGRNYSIATLSYQDDRKFYLSFDLFYTQNDFVSRFRELVKDYVVWKDPEVYQSEEKTYF